MKNVYHIGRFEFDSYTEYKKGLDDVKKIKYISDELDINEPGVALRLYTLIRQKDIKFQSVIGEDYLLYLSDLVADDYKELADGNGTENLAPPPGRSSSPRKIAGILCIIAAILCFAIFIGSEYIGYQRAREAKELQESKDISKAATYIADVINKNLEETQEEQSENAATEEETQMQEAQPETESEIVPKEPVILPEYADLYQQNSDMVGWIKIPDTEVDYPIMQSVDSNEYYLKHNFEKEEDNNGCIFLDMRNNYIDRDDNLIIYGHNMRSGMMFGSLKNYLDEEYWKNHKTILFHTLYEKEEYDIIAVCLAKVEYQDSDVFRYYNFLNAEDEATFEEYKKNIEELKVFSEELDISYGDKLITLSTCNNYVEDGRLFLVAKKKEVSEEP